MVLSADQTGCPASGAPSRSRTADESSPASWRFRVFYDAACPLCSREIAMIRRLDRGRGRVDCVDLSAPDFNAGAFGLEQATIEARIHGQMPDGEIVEGVDVFVHLYDAVGLGWMTAPAHWPGFRWILDRLYLWFARNRLRWTGRAPEMCELPAPAQPPNDASSLPG